MKFKIYAGCYLDGYDDESKFQDIMDFPSKEAAETHAYELAICMTDDWYGQHGFGQTEEDFEEDNGYFDPQEYDDMVRQDVENTAEYWVVQVE